MKLRVLTTASRTKMTRYGTRKSDRVAMENFSQDLEKLDRRQDDPQCCYTRYSGCVKFLRRETVTVGTHDGPVQRSRGIYGRGTPGSDVLTANCCTSPKQFASVGRREPTVDKYTNKKHLKNVGPIRHCEPLHAALPFARCHRLRVDVHNNNDDEDDDDNDNA